MSESCNMDIFYSPDHYLKQKTSAHRQTFILFLKKEIIFFGQKLEELFLLIQAILQKEILRMQ